MNPPPLLTKRKLKRVAPLSVGKILAILYGGMGLLFVPVFLLISLLAPQGLAGPQVGVLAFGMGFAIMVPFMYAAMGFVGGVISAAIYNLAARWVGGIEVEVE